MMIEKRRCKRLPLNIPVRVYGRTLNNRPFREATVTKAVNIHGGLLPLAPRVKRGQTVNIALEALDCQIPARVSEIVPAVDAASRAYIVKIDLPAMPNLRSGMFGRAWFPLGARTVVAVPQPALVDRGQLQSVFTVENGFARTRLVTTGQRAQNAVEVLSGLSEGETVISPLPSALADGARVEVRP